MNFQVNLHLPNDLLVDIGQYLQLSVHVELEICQIVAIVESRSSKIDEWGPEFLKLRKMPQNELIKKAKNVLPNLSQEVPSGAVNYINRCMIYIEQNAKYRHMVVHGAFSFDDTNGDCCINYLHWRRNHGQRIAEQDTTRITQEMRKDALRNLEQLLGGLIWAKDKILAEH
ncbi:hypothetical protein [Pseudooceanicola sp.]|uniref:hypothetical protein n=1 Tax=Pseudooceanicola sp. TaxID=1914328 RepID=UPI00261310E0|nr:hypothetical protein [Pseudooceanicola sp.]MDF1854521.1 hypothetical protein [Pseudooceanicola sp.]